MTVWMQEGEYNAVKVKDIESPIAFCECVNTILFWGIVINRCYLVASWGDIIYDVARDATDI